MSVKGLREEHAQATRTALMKAARELFVQHGFAKTSAEEIVQKARVTRGALYHHFKDKSDLFSAVCDEVGDEMTRRVEEAAFPQAADDPWGAMISGIDAYLDACVEGEFYRLVILEAPVVAGWDEWRAHAEKHELGLIKLGLQMAMDAGVISKLPLDALASVIFGMLNESAMVIGRAKNRKAKRREVGEVVHRFADGLRV